jgi:hypothetical protein
VYIILIHDGEEVLVLLQVVRHHLLLGGVHHHQVLVQVLHDLVGDEVVVEDDGPVLDQVVDEVDDEVVEDGNLFMYYYSWKNLNIMILK